MDEQVLAEGGAFHRSCFKCAKCAGQLTLLTFAAYNGKVFCKPHLKELFLRE
jgi:cysteine/glycine-rich protein